MTTLTLAPSPATGSTRLTITPTATVTAVTATDANGSRTVRTITGQLPHPSGVLTLDDYEAAHGKTDYTVVTAAGTVKASAELVLDSLWLGTPEAPQFSARIASVLNYSTGAETFSTVHQPEGRYDPIVIVRGASTRTGNMTLQAGTYAEALNLLRLCQRGQTMQLRQLQHPGMDMYFVPTKFDIVTPLVAGAASEFDLQLSYIETGNPTGPLSGALGWTWDALLAEYDTWDELLTAYASWGDLRTDTRTS